VAARANGLKKPIRWFAIPQLFRYERQQRGRLREHFQLNCDLVGEPGPLGDAEIIALALDVMRALGLGPAEVRVRLSDRRVLRNLLLGAGVTEPQLGAAYQAVDKIERSDRAALTAQLGEAGLPADAVARVFEVAMLRGLPAVEAALARVAGGAEAGLALRRVVDALAAMGLGEFVEVDLSIVRGLAYYTGTVFELFDAGRTLRAICGGGRYDGLLAALGGVDLPALGFGMGDVVLAELLRDRGLVPTDASSIDVFIAAVTDDDLPFVLALAHELRDAGLRTEYALGAQAVGKQLKLADARNARAAVVIGPDDRARGEVMLKDLVGKGQEAVARTAVVERLRRIAGTTEIQCTTEARRTATE